MLTVSPIHHPPLPLPTLFSRFQGSLGGRAQLATLFPEQTAQIYPLIEQAVLNHTGALERLALGAIALPKPPELLLAALLPLMLYSHELPNAQQAYLRSLCQQWPDPWPTLLQGWSAVLCQLLTPGPMQPADLPHLAHHPQVAQWLAQGYSLSDITMALQSESPLAAAPSPALAVALYCFCATPEDPHLILTCASQHSAIATALATILTGAHHGLTYLSFFGNVPPDLTLATQLWHHWSGAYLPPAHASPGNPIGAAHTLQPRPGRSLISLESQ